MPDWYLATWVLLAAVVAVAVVGILFVLANLIREDERLWRHTQAVGHLREEYDRRLREMQDSGLLPAPTEEGGFDIVEAPASHAAKAA